MNELISILCPTRGRPEFMESLVQSAYETAGKPISIKYLQFIFYIDEDDSGSISKLDSLKHGFNEGTWDKVNVDAVIGPRINLSEAWNRCYEKADGDILFHAGDDLIFKTRGWDAMVRIQFRESRTRSFLSEARMGCILLKINSSPMDSCTGTGWNVSGTLSLLISHQTTTTPG